MKSLKFPKDPVENSRVRNAILSGEVVTYIDTDGKTITIQPYTDEEYNQMVNSKSVWSIFWGT